MISKKINPDVTFLFFNRHEFKMELETFKITVIPLREKLLAYTLKFAEGQIDAEDIVQDVFLKLWSIRDKLDAYQSIEALAYTVAKNKVLDELKKNRTERIDHIEQGGREISYTTHNPENITEQHDTAAHIIKLIHALPSLQQTIIRMKDVEEYSLTEIAEITGTQVEAVRANLSRARKKIREQLLQLHKVVNV